MEYAAFTPVSRTWPVGLPTLSAKVVLVKLPPCSTWVSAAAPPLPATLARKDTLCGRGAGSKCLEWRYMQGAWAHGY